MSRRLIGGSHDIRHINDAHGRPRLPPLPTLLSTDHLRQICRLMRQISDARVPGNCAVPMSLVAKQCCGTLLERPAINYDRDVHFKRAAFDDEIASQDILAAGHID